MHQIEIAPLYILGSNDYMSAFDISQKQSLALLFYNLYLHDYMIGQIFFSLWVLPLGILIYKSGFMPKIFGILFIVETIFGLMSVIVHFLLPNATLESMQLKDPVKGLYTFEQSAHCPMHEEPARFIKIKNKRYTKRNNCLCGRIKLLPDLDLLLEFAYPIITLVTDNSTIWRNL